LTALTLIFIVVFEALSEVVDAARTLLNVAIGGLTVEHVVENCGITSSISKHVPLIAM
jgi:hypothetical protein